MTHFIADGVFADQTARARPKHALVQARRIRMLCVDDHRIVGEGISLIVAGGDEDVYRALEAGAATCLPKDTSSDDLIRALRDVHAGLRTIGPDIQSRLTERAARPKLTGREVEVLALVSEGMANKRITISLPARLSGPSRRLPPSGGR